MTYKDFHPKFYIDTEDGARLHVVVEPSTKLPGEKSVFYAVVDPETGRYLGNNIVECPIKFGRSFAPYFKRSKKRYYLTWAKCIPKRVDKI